MTKQNSYRQKISCSETILLLFVLLFFLTIKSLFFFYANPLPDEAYYWLWSKNIDLSYFDHPPLLAWFQALFLSLIDNRYFAIRALPFLTLGIVLIIMVLWQKHIFIKFDYRACLMSLALFLAFPIFTIFFSISFPDYLLITLLYASSFFLFLYFESNSKFKNGIHFWYLAVLLFSLALLTKYNALLFGIGVLAYILCHKKHIKSPSYGHIVVSTLIIFLIQTPVLVWNLNNDFVSFSFHLNERLDEGKDFITVVKNIAGFLTGVLLSFSPIFIINLKDNFFIENFGGYNKNFLRMSKFVLVFSLAFCIFLSVFTNVLYYWLTPAIILLVPFLINILRFKIWQYLHIFYGLLISIILLINVSIYPIGAFFGSVDRETAILFGWDEIIWVIGKEKKERGIEEVIFTDYRLGSLYIFHSGDLDADVVMEKRKTQFDVWRDTDKQLSKKTLIVSDHDFPIGRKILSSFETIQFVQDIQIYRNANFIKKYQVFLGTNR